MHLKKFAMNVQLARYDDPEADFSIVGFVCGDSWSIVQWQGSLAEGELIDSGTTGGLAALRRAAEGLNMYELPLP